MMTLLHLHVFLLVVAYSMEVLKELPTIGTREDVTCEWVLLGTFEESKLAAAGVTLT